MNDTIVAIATSSGLSSISIVRVSGKKSLSIAKKITKKDKIEPRTAHLTYLYNHQKQLIDQAILIYFISPKSFTGEDIIEFQCHGGIVVAQEILDTVVRYGARLAEAGEFSKRAFLNGKIDLTEAEAVAKLIETKSVEGAKILARQLKGELKDFIDENRKTLIEVISYAEVMIDYAEEDIPNDIIDNIKKRLEDLVFQIENILDSSHRRKGLIEGFRVAIIGKPNVGKSSLLNGLLNYERAIVSDIAGTTRDTIEEEIKIGSHLIRLIDTAGIRKVTEDAIEKIGVERTIKSVEDADIIIAIFDGSRTFDEEDSNILDILKDTDKEVVIVLNKSDLERKFDIKMLEGDEIIRISAKNNIRKLVEKLKDIFGRIGNSEELMLISTRQIETVKEVRNSILESKKPLLNGELEFFSYHLQDAVKRLSSISKPYDSEEILDKMFNEFCLGK